MVEHRRGVINAVIAYSMWGIYPLYWRLLSQIGPTEILVNRMLWSFITLGLGLIVLKWFKPLQTVVGELFINKKKLVALFAVASLLGLNWFIFTYAVTSERIIDASLGYYINPIFNIIIGILFLKEKLNKYQVVSVVLVVIGVMLLTISHGSLPWISLALAVTFGLYGVIKKILNIDAFIGLFLETLLMLPVSSFLFLSWLNAGTSTFSQSNMMLILLLIGAGFITISPLYFFSKATSLLPLKTLGFLQYIGPTIQLIVAITITNETFDRSHFISFSFIWVACVIFSMSHLFRHSQSDTKKRRNRK